MLVLIAKYMFWWLMKKKMTGSWLSGLLSAEIFIITVEWGSRCQHVLTEENSQFLQSVSREVSLVMLTWSSSTLAQCASIGHGYQTYNRPVYDAGMIEEHTRLFGECAPPSGRSGDLKSAFKRQFFFVKVPILIKLKITDRYLSSQDRILILKIVMLPKQTMHQRVLNFVRSTLHEQV